MVKGKTMKIFLGIVAFVSVFATAILVNMDYCGKVHEFWMWKHITWPTWGCFATFVTSYTWFSVIRKK